MIRYVLDASALLALINKEKGWERVLDVLPHSIMSTVNISECAAVLFKLNIPKEEIIAMLNHLVPEVASFHSDQALLTAELKNVTKHKGLSLGDRACLALSIMEDLTAITADQAWMGINCDVNVECIRGV
jgi:PIN domain nuclease of toxin-antitoxin system